MIPASRDLGAVIHRMLWLGLLAVLCGSGAALAQDGGKTQDVTFDDLKLDIEKDGDYKASLLTEKVQELDKQPIRIRGYILPASVFKQQGIKQFVLVRDNMECCFGPGAAIYDCIMVEMTKGNSASFTTKPITVEGKFRLKEYKYPNGKHYAIYHMDADLAK